MKVQLLIYNDSYRKLFRQTPNNDGVWGGVRFLLSENNEADFVICIDRIADDFDIYAPKENIWLINLESPVEEYDWLRKGYKYFSKIFCTDPRLINHPKIIKTNVPVPWFVGKSYDELKEIKEIHKTKNISWITSSYRGRKGHKERMNFYKILTKTLQFDIFGRGFYEIDDKWDAIAPYKYTIAIENHKGKYYWTEKLQDVFLGMAMPIYYGCTEITKYFPKESMILIDIKRPRKAIRIIEKAIQDNLYERNLDAIKYARNLVLDKYQFFPQVTEWIYKYGNFNAEKDFIQLKQLTNLYPYERKKYIDLHRMYFLLKKYIFYKQYHNPDSKRFGQVTY